jgi:hypothetical protein
VLVFTGFDHSVSMFYTPLTPLKRRIDHFQIDENIYFFNLLLFA